MVILDNSKKINDFINNSSKVFITGHKNIDLDALGSSLGLYYYAESKHKEVYIILDDKKLESTALKVIDSLTGKVNFITSNKALTIKNEDSLLIVVDTNKLELLPNSLLLDNFHNTLVIDHHQTGSNSIKNFSVIDLSSSSACEMIAYFLKQNAFVIDSYLATVILSGIVLDTNNFTLRTTANTFNCAYFLTNCGAEVSKVQYLLKQDLKKYIRRQKMVNNVKIVGNIAISKGNDIEIYRREELAKTAASLLYFDKIEASFCIARLDHNNIAISARSMGNIDVGKILTYFGGGGTINEAAAIINNSKCNKVQKELIDILKLF